MPVADAPFRLRWFASLVPARTTRPILEIGCGGGQLLDLLASRCPRAPLVGLDRSALQVRRARERLGGRPDARRPALHCLDFIRGPADLGAERFGLVVAMNVNAFWTDPARAGEAVRRRNAPRGRLLLGYEPPTARGRTALRDKVNRAMGVAGFSCVEEHEAPGAESGVFALALAAGRPG